MTDYMDEFVKNTNFNQNKPIREIVYEGLRKTIISGVVPVGERIIEKEYAGRLNISRTPVREALRKLEEEELVESVHRIGVVVKRISKEDVIEVYKIRHSLEVLATTTAMENITPEELEELEALLNLTEQKNREGDVKEVIRLFGEFNSLIYKASKMKRLASMISKLNDYIGKFRDISITDDERREKALVEHRQILKAISEKNTEGIDKIVERHLHISLDIVYSTMKDEE
ncbi:GntR family transcriptional regulator [Clostridium carboxidivorans P7]|uniref:Transcriptional regulator, GntR family n=1 Tax=Clostridium carboxidivorans P7 TaxID=536227 RepID=C6PSW8_9CLOT|nr:GntR family transcriptional regulator [Clostridium carboxidivorans]AKN32441.1 GntR family transcriptional regulator [Clostridium carboxidivorans P7]EET87603.1 transcriptional regulator, GntR family [Clostridium carboxidivorans P7]